MDQVSIICLLTITCVQLSESGLAFSTGTVFHTETSTNADSENTRTVPTNTETEAPVHIQKAVLTHIVSAGSASGATADVIMTPVDTEQKTVASEIEAFKEKNITISGIREAKKGSEIEAKRDVTIANEIIEKGQNDPITEAPSSMDTSTASTISVTHSPETEAPSGVYTSTESTISVTHSPETEAPSSVVTSTVNTKSVTHSPETEAPSSVVTSTVNTKSVTHTPETEAPSSVVTSTVNTKSVTHSPETEAPSSVYTSTASTKSVTHSPETEAPFSVDTSTVNTKSVTHSPETDALTDADPTTSGKVTVNEVSSATTTITETFTSGSDGKTTQSVGDENTTSGSISKNPYNLQTSVTSQGNTSTDTLMNTGAAATDNTVRTVTEILTTDTPCPRFPSRMEQGKLFISYVENRCEMVVTMDTEVVTPLTILQLFKDKNRIIRRPRVKFQTLNEEKGEPCQPLPTTLNDPIVFVDTMMNRCYIKLEIQKVTNSSDLQEEKDTPRHKFIPVYQYMDDGQNLEVATESR